MWVEELDAIQTASINGKRLFLGDPTEKIFREKTIRTNVVGIDSDDGLMISLEERRNARRMLSNERMEQVLGDHVILIHSAKLRTGPTKDLAEPWHRHPGHRSFGAASG